eukprot:gene17949-biopygen23390
MVAWASNPGEDAGVGGGGGGGGPPPRAAEGKSGRKYLIAAPQAPPGRKLQRKGNMQRRRRCHELAILKDPGQSRFPAARSRERQAMDGGRDMEG